MEVETKTEMNVSMDNADLNRVLNAAVSAISDNGPAGKIAARKQIANDLEITTVQAQKVINAIADDTDLIMNALNEKHKINLEA